MRIYELSKLLKVPSKRIMEAAEKELGIEGIKNHMSSVSELDAARIQKLFLKTYEQAGKKENKATTETHKRTDADKQKDKPSQKKESTQKGSGQKEKKASKGNEPSVATTEAVPKRPRRNLQKKEKGKKQQYKKSKDSEEDVKESGYFVGDSIKVKDFSEMIDMPVNILITKLISNGIMANLNQDIDFETAFIIAEEAGIELEKEEV
ncbi:MAG: translation initiation factor IF-2 N-terminal domain-containing protein, partial [Tissierellales bacterium]|nr:translation initiation factor IF-2 N-terminal domain-containing protein [Tissierellales bacterium]